MGVLSDNAIIGASAAGGYDIDNSCRFNAPDNSYLSRTPGAASNRKTWTWSGWVKRGNPTQRGYLFSSGTAVGSNEDGIEPIHMFLVLLFGKPLLVHTIVILRLGITFWCTMTAPKQHRQIEQDFM